MASHHIPNLVARCNLTRACLALLLFSHGAIQLLAQTSSDPCTNAAANRYPVNATCNPLPFNKPAAYTYNYNPGSCNSGTRDDAFGNFIATGTLTTVQYTPTGGTDAILHVLATCTGPSLGCSDVALANGTETVTLATVPGTMYYVRVQRYNSNGAMNGTLCIFNSDCLYRLTLYDSFGDGWGDFFGQAYAEIVVNGVSLGLYTLNSGASGYVDFGIRAGDNVQIVYSDGGAAYYTENSMGLSVGGNCIFNTPAPPMIGTVYNGTASCSPPSTSALQDCVGGATVCSNGNLSNSSTNLGCTFDLNASNQGCLLSGERQGSWYYFSPSTSGTLGFTITPSANVDYDFALWGPFSGTQCPTGPPARCSYYDNAFYGTYTTGMGGGATDNSEGAYTPPATNDGWVSTMNVTAGSVYVLYVDNFSATGQDFTLTWNLSNGASLDCTTLPVELLSLNATARGPVIDVDWATATERNADFFDVERSPDNHSFARVGTVPAAGDAQYRNDYLFTDPAPIHGANYYRLKQVDRNGEFTYTHTVVAFMGLGGHAPVVFPNPASDLLQVAFNSPLDGTCALFVEDALGRTVATVTETVARGTKTTEVPLTGLAQGWYNVRIALPDGSMLQGSGFIKR